MHPDQVVDGARIGQRPRRRCAAAGCSTARCGAPAHRRCRTASRSTAPRRWCDSGRKCPPRRSVSMPMASADSPVSSSANSRPIQGDMPLRGGEPGGRIGRDADEGRLPEGGGATHAGQQHQAQRDQRADADVVEQRDGEVAGHAAAPCAKASDHQADPEVRLREGGVHWSTSSSSSSECTLRKERSISTGISRLKTITSFSAPLQNEAKLSTTPTASAPMAVIG